MNFFTKAAEGVVSSGLSLSLVSKPAYELAKSATSVSAPFVLQFFCIMHEKILTEASKAAMNEFIKINLATLHTKYEILSKLCKNENIDPFAFIREHEVMVRTMLSEIGIDPDIVKTPDALIQSINANLQSILAYIGKKIKVLEDWKLTGGTRRRKYKRRTRVYNRFRSLRRGFKATPRHDGRFRQ
jgi:hypothetical protein